MLHPFFEVDYYLRIVFVSRECLTCYHPIIEAFWYQESVGALDIWKFKNCIDYTNLVVDFISLQMYKRKEKIHLCFSQELQLDSKITTCKSWNYSLLFYITYNINSKNFLSNK